VRARLRTSPPPSRAQRLIRALTAAAVLVAAVGLWLGRARPPDLPAVYQQADLEVTGLT